MGPPALWACHQGWGDSCLAGNDAPPASISAGGPTPPPSCSRGSLCGTWEARRGCLNRQLHLLGRPSLQPGLSGLPKGGWTPYSSRLGGTCESAYLHELCRPKTAATRPRSSSQPESKPEPSDGTCPSPEREDGMLKRVSLHTRLIPKMIN